MDDGSNGAVVLIGIAIALILGFLALLRKWAYESRKRQEEEYEREREEAQRKAADEARERMLEGHATIAAREWPLIGADFLAGWIWETRKDVASPSEFRCALNDIHVANLKVGANPSDESVIVSLGLLLLQDERRSITTAAEIYANHVRAGSTAIGTREERAAALKDMQKIAYEWVKKRGFHVSEKADIKIAEKDIVRILEEFSDQKSLRVGTQLSRQFQAELYEYCLIPSEQLIIAAIVCTFWGSGKRAIVFTETGLFWRTSEDRSRYIRYSDFPDTVFSAGPDDTISCGTWGKMSPGFSDFPAQHLILILSGLQGLVHRRTRSGAPQSSGLNSLAGMRELKTLLLNEVVEPLRDPEKFQQYGISVPEGLLLYGPPGCGKTYIVKALAAELGRNFFALSPGDFASRYVHGTTEIIRSAFDDAARNAPSILFLDEFEGMVPKRSELGGDAQYKAEEVNELLAQIGSAGERQILVIAATNEPWKIDEAIRRTGRFDKKILVEPPDEEAQLEILQFYLRNRRCSEALDGASMVGKLNGYSASDLKVLVDEAAKLAMRDNEEISTDHLRQASLTVRPSISDEQLASYRQFQTGSSPFYKRSVGFQTI